MDDLKIRRRKKATLIISVAFLIIILTFGLFKLAMEILDPVTIAERHGRHAYLITTKGGRYRISDELPYEEISKLVGTDKVLSCGTDNAKEDNMTIYMKDVISISKFR